MIVLSSIKMKIPHTQEELQNTVWDILRQKPDPRVKISIRKRSLDARYKPDLYYIYTVILSSDSDYENQLIKRLQAILKRNHRITAEFVENDKVYSVNRALQNDAQVVIVGAGPAGLFAAYILAQAGIKPIVLERGKPVDERQKDVDAFWNTGVLLADSNVQFGEGGAGTFSDGKLNTQIKDSSGRMDYVRKTFALCGADESVLFDAKPHVGTDVLKRVVSSLRKRICDLGGQFMFETKMISLVIQNGRIISVNAIRNNSEINIPADYCILAIGHSARDTFAVCKEMNIPMEPKPFAVGLRVIHNQSVINKSQYGTDDIYELGIGAADYKVTATTEDGHRVYSFCNCPGGYVVNASSEEGGLCINGMSYSGRNSRFSNSALVVAIDVSDYTSHIEASDIHNPLNGVQFQRQIERSAFTIGNGTIPVQRYVDFCSKDTNCEFSDLPDLSGALKGQYVSADLRKLLPEELTDAINEAMDSFGKKIDGFCSEDVYLAGVEARTSSPLRILRNEYFESSISGLYPCGEGAGYAGGITSAAVDGMKVAEAIINKINGID